MPDIMGSLVRRAPPTPAPSGIINYNSPDDIGYKLMAATYVTLCAAMITVIFRMVNKVFVAKSRPSVDDYFSVLAFLFAIARAGCNSWEVWRAGVGRHVWDIRPKYYHSILNVYEIGNVVYLFGILCAKLSIICFYLSIFGKTNRRFRWTCIVLAFVVTSYTISSALATLFACNPEAATWNRDIPATCIGLRALDITVGALNIATDTALLLLPVPILLRLQTTSKRKLELLASFGTGAFVVATTIIRVFIVVKTLQDFDQTRAIIGDMIWLTIELNMGILCGCLPLMRPLIRYIGNTKVFSSVSTSVVRLLSTRTSNTKSKHAQDHENWHTEAQKNTSYQTHTVRGTNSEDTLEETTGIKPGSNKIVKASDIDIELVKANQVV